MSAPRSSRRLALAGLLIALGALGLVAIADRRDTRPDRSPALTTPAPRSPAPTRREVERRVPWTRGRLLRRLEGRRIRIGDRRVRLRGDTLACGGVGRAESGRGGARAWRRFRCVQPTFPPGTVAGPDAIFFVEPSGRKAFAVVGGRFTSY
jgi:hypothetical protein